MNWRGAGTSAQSAKGRCGTFSEASAEKPIKAALNIVRRTVGSRILEYIVVAVSAGTSARRHHAKNRSQVQAEDFERELLPWERWRLAGELHGVQAQLARELSGSRKLKSLNPIGQNSPARRQRSQLSFLAGSRSFAGGRGSILGTSAPRGRTGLLRQGAM